MGRTELGAKELCDGSETTLHSHAGGNGSGSEMQSGRSTAPKATVVQVNFSPEFSGVPRISISPWSQHIVLITEVTTAYFKWNNDSKNVDVTVDWIAINV